MPTPFIQSFATVPWAVVVAAALVAAVVDLRRRRIPNGLTGPLLLAGLAWSAWMAGWGGLGNSLLGTLVTGVPFVALWLVGGGGAGDAKMMLAIGAWLGWRQGATALLGVALAGGVLALGVALAQRRATAALQDAALALLGAPLDRPAEYVPLPRIPYAVAIFAGVCSAAAVWISLCAN